jgi:hypothetical protein
LTAKKQLLSGLAGGAIAHCLPPKRKSSRGRRKPFSETSIVFILEKVGRHDGLPRCAELNRAGTERYETDSLSTSTISRISSTVNCNICQHSAINGIVLPQEGVGNMDENGGIKIHGRKSAAIEGN